MYDTVVFIGRFQSFHISHLRVIMEGLAHLTPDGKLIIFVGSSDAAPSIRNPWNFLSRINVIKNAVAETGGDITKITFLGLPDYTYNDNRWKANLIRQVEIYVGDNIALIGHQKDHTGYFLKMFPEWHSISVAGDGISASPIRDRYFTENSDWIVNETILPDATKRFLLEWRETPEYIHMRHEYNAVKAQKVSHIVHMVNACIVHGNTVMMEQRNTYPGKTLWQLPEIELKGNKTISGVLREIVECEIPEIVQTKSRVFDNPERDARGRYLSHTHLLDFGLIDFRPVPTGNRRWWHIADLHRGITYADHMDIIWEMHPNFGRN